MHADVERFTFDPSDHFLRVVEQQGRVALAADTNEQTAILVDYLRRLAADVIGPYGTPANEDNNGPGSGFFVDVADGTLLISPGRFWVDGLLCVNEETVPYRGQPDYPDAPVPAGRWVVLYLDVWERHVTAAQHPRIRDVALGGPDTSSRSQVVWQVKALPASGISGNKAPDFDSVHRKLWPTWLAEIDGADRGRLAVESRRPTQPLDPCLASPDSGYVGHENQHYRVEIHRGSPDGEGPGPTFKWSRDNGSVVYPVAQVEGATATLVDPPIDCRKQLAAGTLVEVVDDLASLHNRPGHLARVVEVDDDGDEVIVHLDRPVPDAVDPARHPLLRRWDHPDVAGGGEVPVRADDGALELVESGDTWLALEDGIRIRFAPSDGDQGPRRYRTGDHWTFAARTATGDVAWPRVDGVARAEPPHGIEHRYAPLAVAKLEEGKVVDQPVDCRVGFARLAVLPPLT
jgi:hypothetical protein